jgi:ketosteroid isomerase-like protein
VNTPLTDFAVLDANSAFYRAFAARDVAALEAVWSGERPVACIHPGWDVVSGRQEVMKSWRAILAGAGAGALGAITCSHAFVQVLGEVALVVCRERVGDGEFVATNVFAREADGWRMVHHQASPLRAPVEGRGRQAGPPN